jgi:hypothetical protein
MGKSGSTTQMKSSIRKPNEPHEVWRGIGCLMILVIPAISIVAGYGTVTYALDHQWTIPYQLLGTPRLPDIVYRSTGLQTIFVPLTKIPNLYANIVISLLYMLLISSLISVTYAVIYRIVGPSRYGPTDAPPLKVRVKKKSR